MYGRSILHTLLGGREGNSSFVSCPSSNRRAGNPLTPQQEIKGELNLKTSDCLLDTTILGFPLETLKGNMDDGVYINVNIAVAKGYLDIYIVDGNPKDEVWMLADLHLPLRQHFYKKIHMFNIPHHPGPPRPHRPLREHPWPLPPNLPATS